MARFTELYDVLEISPDSDQQAIKKAYRQLAVKYHPDKNPGNKEAEEKFKKLAHAYEILSDPEKRARYDQFGEDAFQAGGAGGGFGANPFDIFNDIFGGGGGDPFSSFFHQGGRARDPHAAVRGANLRYNMQITLQEAFSGIAAKKIEFNRKGTCPDCKGTGCAPGTHTESCKHCGGRGQVAGQALIFTVMKDCPVCNGRGYVIPKKCSKCGGSGDVSVHRSLSIRIPPGVDHGNRMRVAGEGEPGRNGGPNGDLELIFLLKEDPVFERQGNDLFTDVHIPFHLAALGGTITIPAIDGTAELKIAQGAQYGDVYTVRGAGMPILNHDKARGNMHVRCFVDVPKKLTNEQKDALRAYAALFPEDAMGKVNENGGGSDPNGFFKKAKDFFNK